jgi:hypothetical protein
MARPLRPYVTSSHVEIYSLCHSCSEHVHRFNEVRASRPTVVSIQKKHRHVLKETLGSSVDKLIRLHAYYLAISGPEARGVGREVRC